MKFKKILSLLTAAAMTLSLGITSVSADTTEAAVQSTTTTVASVKIGTAAATAYPTLEAAITAANSASKTAKVTLTSNVSIDDTLVLTQGVTLDLGAYTITNNSQGEAIRVAFGKGTATVKATSGGITSIGKPCFVIKGDSVAYEEIKAATTGTPSAAQINVNGGKYDSGKANEAITFSTDAPENCQLRINNNSTNGTNIIGGINLDSGTKHRSTRIYGSKTVIESSCRYTINAGKSSGVEISDGATIESYGDYAIYAPQGSTVTVNKAFLHIYGNRGLYADGGKIEFKESSSCFLYAEGTNTQYIFNAANGGSVTVTGGGVYDLKNASNVFGNGVTIKKGQYYLENASNVFADDEVRTTISGGKFHGTSETIDAVKARIAAGSENAVDTFPVVAKISDTKTYTTLAEAFAAATDGATITLVDDADVTTGNITVDGIGVTLDLNGHDVSAANNEAGDIDLNNKAKLTLVDTSETPGTIRATDGKGLTNCLIDVHGGSEFVMNSGNINAAYETPKNNGANAVGLWDDAVFTMNGGTITAGWYCAAGNGIAVGSESYPAGAENSKIIINGGTLVSTMDYAIYAPAINGSVTVAGGTIEGAAGAIAMNRGTLNVTGGKLVSTNLGDTGSTWGDGTANMHNSVIDFCSRYDGGITATISGGELAAQNGAYLFRLGDYPKNLSGAAYYGVDLKITNGTFTAEGDSKTFMLGEKYEADKSEIAISGGAFSEDISKGYKDYIADGYEVVPEKGLLNVYPYAEARTSKVRYATLQDAINKEGTGAIISVLHNIDVANPITVTNKKVTIILNGYTITATGNNNVFDVSGSGKFKIKNGSPASKIIGTVAANGGKCVNATNSTVTLEDVNFTQENAESDLIYADGTTTVTINSGSYKAVTPEKTLVKNGDSANFKVTGGTFYQYDPTAFVNTKTYYVGSDGEYFTVVSTPVAENAATGVKYATLSDAVKAVEAGQTATINLIADISSGRGAAMVTDNKDITINLNSHTIRASKVNSGVFVVGDAKLTIEGEGTVTALQNGGALAFDVLANATVNIKGGNFSQEISNDDGKGHYDFIYIEGNNSTVNISGGTFTAFTPKWTLNKFDSVTGSTFNVTGGKFVGYNPAESDTEPNGPVSFVADSYVATADANGNYTVENRTENFGTVAVMTHGKGELTLLSGINFLDYRNAGFIVDFGGGNTKTVDTTVVYENVTAGGDTKTADDFGTKYIFGAKLDISEMKDTLKSFTIKPFAKVLNKNEVVEADEVTTVNITTTEQTID